MGREILNRIKHIAALAIVFALTSLGMTVGAQQRPYRLSDQQVKDLVIQEDGAQTILDAEMEMTRKDSAGAPERRRQQLARDFERTNRGWKIINITPREFFRPL